VRKRAQHADEIVPKLHSALHARTALEWESYLGDDVPCAAARAVEDVFDNAQVLAEHMVASLEHPLVGRYRGLSRAIKFDRTPGPAPFAAPTFGQHSDTVLQQTGCSMEEIEQLRSKGAVL
jgi:crotonobetainyl-CoA:carnitine CoA-transferase CaiB-like acyl-CoA transferase